MRSGRGVRFPDTADELSFETVCRDLRERGPVLPVELPDGLRTWVITRYAEGREALRDPRLIKDLRSFSDPRHGFGGNRYCEDIYAVEGRHVLNTDGDQHLRLRQAIIAPLSREAIARRRPEIERICVDRVTDFSGKPEIDLMSAYAHPVTETVMARVLGIPDETLLAAAVLNRRLGLRENPGSAPMRRAYLDLVDLIIAATREPPAAEGETVVSALHEARAAHRLNRRELVSTVMMLLSAGISSTAIAIGHGAATVMRMASTLRHLLDDDDSAAVLVEELVRHHPPFPFSPWRFAREEVEVGGVAIPAGAVVFVLLAAANRDPDRVADPDEIRPGGTGRTGHLGFGHGPHFCVGAHLARLETTVALQTLFRLLPEVSLACPYDEVRWQGLLFDRTPVALPVRTPEMSRTCPR